MDWLGALRRGAVIPAHPLALTSGRKFDERRQRALTRYYLDAGVGGIAVGVHTTQFAIREAGLLTPVLSLAAEMMRGHNAVRIAGICGGTRQAVAEAECATRLGYHAGLLSMAALPHATVDQLMDHAKAVAEVIPLVGFYLQPAVGGPVLPLEFWRRFASLERVVAIKIAPFHRYRTLDVLRGVAESGRAGEVALYTGNDDNILVDLLTEFDVSGVKLRIVGGLLGHWAVWTRKAVEQFNGVCKVRESLAPIPPEWLTLASQVTESNAALFDVANDFRGCIAGIHEVLRRQGLLEGIWCLDEKQRLSPGQPQEIDRIYKLYPHLTDDDFVRENLDRWLR